MNNESMNLISHKLCCLDRLIFFKDKSKITGDKIRNWREKSKIYERSRNK